MRRFDTWVGPSAVAAACSVAIAVVALAATFVVAYALLWRPLGVDEPERLVHVAVVDQQARALPVPSVIADAIGASQMFDGTCRFVTPYSTARIAGRVDQRPFLVLDGGCFAVLGTGAAIGRLFTATEDHARAAVAVLTHRTWQRDFGGRADVLGESITLDGATYAIVGVTEPRFDGLALGFPAAAILPLDTYRAGTGGHASWYFATLFARLRPETRLDEVKARLSGGWSGWLTTELPAGWPEAQRRVLEESRLDAVAVAGGLDYVLRDRFRRPVVAVLLLGVLVAIVSLNNVAHLLVARLLARRQELRVRLALGGDRWRIALDSVREWSVIVAVGGAAGVWLAIGLSRAFAHRIASLYPGSEIDVSLGPQPMALIALPLVVALVTVLVVTLAVTRSLDLGTLSSAHERVAGAARRPRQLLLSTAVLMTMVLLAVNLLTIRTLRERATADTGVRVDEVVTASLASLPDELRRTADDGYYPGLVDRLLTLPGAESVALTRFAPFHSRPYAEPVSTDSVTAPPAEWHIVSEDFFTALGIQVIAGRAFTRADDQTRGDVAVLSRTLATQLFGSGEAIGRQVRTARHPVPLTVVGVVADVALLDPKRGPGPALYRSFWQLPADQQTNSNLVVRFGRGAASAAIPEMVRAIEQGGREYPATVRRLTEQFEQTFLEERLVAWLGAGFSLVGFVVSMIGVYSIAAQTVGQRRRELGIRAAIGARPAVLRRIVLTDATSALLPGWLLGLPCAGLAYRGASRLLTDGSGEPVVVPVLLAAMLVGVAAIVAAIGPGNRAARTDPAEALRSR